MKTAGKVILVIAISLLFTGCASYRYSPQEFPVIEKTSGSNIVSKGVGVIATTSTRRVVIINKKDHTFCAEPSPDTSNNLISAVETMISASAQLEGLSVAEKGELAKLTAEAKAHLARNLNSTVDQLFKPTQGLKVLRDGWFAICQAQVNGFTSNEQYFLQFRDLLSKIFGDPHKGVIGLIETEFDYELKLASIKAPVELKAIELQIIKANNDKDKISIEKNKIELAVKKVEKEKLELQTKIDNLKKENEK